MAAATCTGCGAWTSTATGYCTVCRRWLGDSPRAAATAPAPPGAGAAAYVGLAPAYPAPPFAPPGYALPAYASQGYPPASPPPLYAPAGPQIPVAQFLAKQAVGLRWAAAIMDFVIVFAVWFLSFPYLDALGASAGLGLTMLWGFSYYTIPDAAGLATPGKLTAGLRVVDIRLQPAGALRIAGRTCELFVWAILFGLLFFLIQLYYTLKIGQGLGDYLTKTYVVRKRDLALLRPNAG